MLSELSPKYPIGAIHTAYITGVQSRFGPSVDFLGNDNVFGGLGLGLGGI